jgi:hypothetical protein
MGRIAQPERAVVRRTWARHNILSLITFQGGAGDEWASAYVSSALRSLFSLCHYARLRPSAWIHLTRTAGFKLARPVVAAGMCAIIDSG